jgi:hypothetical protein
MAATARARKIRVEERCGRLAAGAEGRRRAQGAHVRERITGGDERRRHTVKNGGGTKRLGLG